MGSAPPKSIEAALVALEQALVGWRQRLKESSESMTWEAQDELEALKRRLQNEVEGTPPALRNAAPGAEADGQTQAVVALAMVPRTVAGKYQDDFLMRKILHASDRRPWDSLLANKIDRSIPLEHALRVTLAAFETKPAAGWFLSSLFYEVAERLQHLETYRPIASDHAIEALQDAFVGLMQTKHTWGAKGYPTKGMVEAMAKARLAEQRMKWRGTWTDLLREAGLDWLPQGKAGRPSKADLDENRAAEIEAKTIFTKEMNKTYGGDWVRALARLRPARGSKAEFQREERERRNSTHEIEPEE